MRWAVFSLIIGLAVVGCKQGTASNQPASESFNPSPSQPRHDRSSGGASNAQPGQFDFYVLNLSWSPEFCFQHPDKPECAAHPAFVMHGLWPQNRDGSYPEHCSDDPGPRDASAYADVYPDAGLLHHEWTTHGTCSGMKADAYFSAARKAFTAVKIPPALANDTRRLQLPPQEILGDFIQVNPGLTTDDMALSCGNNFLTAVEVCLDKDLHPTSCGMAVKTCHANVVKVTPPGSSRDQ